MCGKLIYLLSLVLSLSIPTYQAKATYPFLQDSGPYGIVSMEAENYDDNWPGLFHTWELVQPLTDASGSIAMQALPDIGHNYSSSDNYRENSPRLDFKVSFVKTGTHYVWVRGYASDESSDSCHAGLDDWADPNGKRIKFDKIAEWGWFDTNDSSPPKRATLDVKSTGIHTVNIWMREDGAIIDKIVLTTNPAYTPSDEGPKESTRGNPLSVDDFEKYDVTNRIFETWIDGLVNGTGSVIGHSNSPYVEQTIVYGGGKSMPFYYDNNRAGKAYYSETEADTAKLEIGSDWTKEGVKALTLYFYGNTNNAVNATERMYVALQDNDSVAVVYYDGNSNDVRDPNWHEWDIKLTDFINVELNSVKKVYIGFGNRYHPTPGGSGLVYFDDIRLYPPRCVPSRVKGNFNDDCVVDFDDLGPMVDEWLNTVPPETALATDLNGDNKVDLKDYAVLAQHWLEEVLWP